MRKSLYKALSKLKKAVINEKGEEVLNPKPIAWPTGVNPPESMENRISRMVRQQWEQLADQNEFDSYEDSQDFGPIDDPWDEMPESPYEIEEFELEPEEIQEVPAASDLDEQPPPVEGGEAIELQSRKTTEQTQDLQPGSDDVVKPDGRSSQ